MTRIAKAALTYWAAIFALGFVLGVCRVLWMAPALGETRAVLLELPIMLAASWWWAAWIVRTQGIADRTSALAVGILAFALLLGAEALLAVVLDQGLAEWCAALSSPSGLLGLAGQLAFAAMPAARACLRGSQGEGCP